LLLGAVRAGDIGRQSSAQHAETAPQHGAQQQVHDMLRAELMKLNTYTFVIY